MNPETDEPPKPTHPYDDIFPALHEALLNGDTKAWDKTALAVATQQQLDELEIPYGVQLERSIGVHRNFETLFQLAHRAALQLTGEIH